MKQAPFVVVKTKMFAKGTVAHAACNNFFPSGVLLAKQIRIFSMGAAAHATPYV